MTVLLLNSGPVRAQDGTGEGSSTPAPQVDNLTVAAASWKDKKFTGSPISLNMKDADVLDVLRMIGETSGFNVVVHPSVGGRITVSLEEVPWDQALEVVLSTLRLGAERSQSVLRVMPRDLLLAEAQARVDAQKAQVKTAPKYTRIFPVSYAEPNAIKTMIQSYTGTGAGNASDPSASFILLDENTQSLIVRDSAESLERIKKLIQILDVQTPQIVIDAKVIDATESFSKAIDGRLAFGSSDSSRGVYLNGGTLPLAGSAATPFDPGGANAVKIGVGGSTLLNALLTYSESESKAKVISSPRVLVMSGKAATINQTSNLAVTQQVISVGSTSVAVNFVPVPTTLSVTPRATNEGSVFMNLNFTRSTVQVLRGQSTPASRNITTDVIVDSGNTLVLGGVQSVSETESSAGMPFLRKIPLIGWLFGSEEFSREKSELMFFVTPRILNMKRAGLGDNVRANETGANDGEMKTQL